MPIQTTSAFFTVPNTCTTRVASGWVSTVRPQICHSLFTAAVYCSSL